MNFLKVTDFKDPFAKALGVIANRLNKSNEINSDLYFNEDISFINRFKKVTKKDLSIGHSRINNNFPSIYSSGIVFDSDNFVLKAGASEYMNESGIFLCKNKARGEFLERLSTFMPVDLCIKYDFDMYKINQEIINNKKNIVGRNFLNDKKVKLDYGEVYRGLHDTYQEIKYVINGVDRKKIQGTTNGAAGYFDKDNAILNAILEMVQRDSFLMYWLNSISPKKIDVEEFILNNKKGGERFNQLKALYENIKKYNINIYFLDITSDVLIPSVACVAVIEENYIKIQGLGASSGFDADSAFLSAMTEAVCVLSENYKKDAYALNQNYKPFFDKNISRENRLKVYRDNNTLKQFKYFEFFINNTNIISVSDFMSCVGNVKKDIGSKLDYVKKIFVNIKKENKDFNLCYVEIENKLLDEFDYSVVKVISYYFYNLYLSENYADPNHPRLNEFVKNKGLEKEAKLNMWPHPFP